MHHVRLRPFLPAALLCALFSSACATAAVQSTDVKVPGTDYEATGMLPCSMHTAPKTTQCSMGVKRLGDQRAIVDVTFPDGHKRSLSFNKGRVTSGKAKVESKRDEDNTVVSIDGGSEVIRVPDAVIEGG